MRNQNLVAFVLKNTKSKESDRIYTLFSKDKGVFSAFAKGVRKISSRRSGNLDTLSLIEVNVTTKDSELYFINEVKVISSYDDIKSDLKKVSSALYMCELVFRTYHGDEHAERLFEAFKDTLDKISENENYSVHINKFELKYLQLLGYGPEKDLLYTWRGLCEQKRFKEADYVLKDYLRNTFDTRFKSLTY